MNIETEVSKLKNDFSPNVALDLIRILHRDWPANAWRGQKVAEIFKHLDEWLSQGGFPPGDWDWNPLWSDKNG